MTVRLPIAGRSRCTQSWDAMQGDDRVRHCAHCDQYVYNLSAMRAGEVDYLIEKTRGELCVRYFERPDGTVITRNCAPAPRVWAALRMAAAIALGASAGAAVIPYFPERHRTDGEVRWIEHGREYIGKYDGPLRRCTRFDPPYFEGVFDSKGPVFE